jgi:hypothetical protein
MNHPIPNSSPHNDETRPIRAQLEPTKRALADAHDAVLRSSMDAVRWERRGFLGRLTRSR